jgi:hypothetical protein
MRVDHFSVAELPSHHKTLDELFDQRKREFARKDAAMAARRLVPVRVTVSGPYGIAHFGDPHVDDPGTDLALLERHVSAVSKTYGLFAGNIGDMHNNWVGKLIRLYAKQETTAKESWMLVEWLMRAMPWLYVVMGNHDCHDASTEAFVRGRGWCRHDEIKDEDLVLGFNRKTGNVEWQPILKKVARWHDGSMVKIDAQPVSFNVTPNHRVLTKARGSDEWKYEAAADMTGRRSIMVAGSYHGNCTMSEDEVRLAAWIATDGHASDRGYVTIYQKDVTAISALLGRMGIEHAVSYRERKTAINDRHYETVQGEVRLSAQASRSVAHLVSKVGFPDWVWEMNDTQFVAFAETLVEADGSWGKAKSGYISDKAKPGWLDALQGLFAMHGWSAWIKNVPGRAERRLNFTAGRKEIDLAVSEVRQDGHYTGTVWCLTTPLGNFLVRRDGKSHFSGNCWSGDGDPLEYMLRNAPGVNGKYGVRINLESPNGTAVRVNARHDFHGHSMWNTVHGPVKAAKMGWRDHILICGHKHTSGYAIEKDPATGLISHVLRVASYKTHDDYAEELGLPNQCAFPSCVTIIDPDEPDDSVRRVTFFPDVEFGADYLTWLRAKRGY